MISGWFLVSKNMETPDLNPYIPPASAFVSQVSEDLVFQEASKGKRFLNYLFDYCAIIGLAAVLGILVAIMEEMGILSGAVYKLQHISKLEDYVFTAMLSVFYYVTTEAFFGRSLGKLITGTKVISDAGTKPSYLAILGRSLSRCVPFDGLSFLLASRGWHDSWSSTQVIDVRKPMVAAMHASMAKFYR